MDFNNLDNRGQFYGRKAITTYHTFVGDVERDAETAIKVLASSLPIHQENVESINHLFDIYNNTKYWTKTKVQRPDINNVFSIGSAYAISRTINSYCFGEPIKYISRVTDDNGDKQEKVELLSEYLDFSGNHSANIMATMCSSICGLGYKLALPANEVEYSKTGIPFVINKKMIFPQDAFCVYSDSVIPQKVMGVVIGKHRDKNGNVDGTKYNVYTENFQFNIINTTSTDGYKVEKQNVGGVLSYGYPIASGRIPLVEVERNAFRKGDWEVAEDLFMLKNKLMSDRFDDIEQVIDYILVLYNCQFENDEDKKNALKNRLFEISSKGTNNGNKPSVEILKNQLDQSAIQELANYIDTLIEEVVGIPNRAERGGGGHDTGTAVIYRNGFRDLSNNAGIILPKMDSAELEFIDVCLSISHKCRDDRLKGLNAYDVRNKFVSSQYDNPSSTSSAYSTFRSAGMNDLDALIASRAVTDPAEVAKNNRAYQDEVKRQQATEVIETTNIEEQIA